MHGNSSRRKSAAAWLVVVLLSAARARATPDPHEAPAPTAQSALRDWSSVKAEPLGERVRIRTADGKTFEGTLERADDDGISIQSAHGPILKLRAGVVRVERVARTRSQDAGRGFLYGAGAGAAWGAVATKSNRGAWAGILALGWGAIGMAIGAIGGLGSRYQLVYDANVS